MKWVEYKNNIRSFQLKDEPEVIHILKIRDDEYLIIHEDGYDLNTGKTEFSNKENIKNKYNIKL